MTRVFTNIQVPTPDFYHNVGQTLLRPISLVLGHTYQGVEKAPVDSLVKRVTIAALAIIAFPLTLLAAALGALLLSYSVTHKTAFEAIQKSKITISWNQGKPEIRTPQVLLRPIRSEDLPVYQALFNNAVAMGKYAGGVRDITNRFNIWLGRWNEHSFSALAVVDLQTQKVIGHSILGHGDYEGNLNTGWSEGAIVLEPGSWKKHIGSEVARATLAYAKALKEKGGLVPSDVTPEQRPQLEQLGQSIKVHRNGDSQIDWVYLPFTEVRATAHKENAAMVKILGQLLSENHATKVPKNAERDLFIMNL